MAFHRLITKGICVFKRRSFRPTASFWEANRIALDSLQKNKLRSFLTLLGIILATTTSTRDAVHAYVNADTLEAWP